MSFICQWGSLNWKTTTVGKIYCGLFHFDLYCPRLTFYFCDNWNYTDMRIIQLSSGGVILYLDWFLSLCDIQLVRTAVWKKGTRGFLVYLKYWGYVSFCVASKSELIKNKVLSSWFLTFFFLVPEVCLLYLQPFLYLEIYLQKIKL